MRNAQSSSFEDINTVWGSNGKVTSLHNRLGSVCQFRLQSLISGQLDLNREARHAWNVEVSVTNICKAQVL